MVDTNVAIEMLRRSSDALRRFHPDATVFVPVIVLGELFHGAFASARIADNMAEVEDFAASVKVLVCDLGVARRFGEIRRDSWRKGTPIPDNDVWIAATALVHGLPIVTSDAHFDQVDGLTVVRW
jgi:tRNA(fMet)-specific endonuclease VapC